MDMASQQSSSLIPTRILITSDTHGKDFVTERQLNGSETQPPLRADVVIHCGDLTAGSRLDEYRAVIDFLSQVDAPLRLCIAGNHDFTLDELEFSARLDEYAALEAQRREKHAAVEGHHGAHHHVHNDSTHHHHQRHRRTKSLDEAVARRYGAVGDSARLFCDAAREHNVHLLTEGTHVFSLANGARLTVFASPYTPAYGVWGFQYPGELGHDFPMRRGGAGNPGSIDVAVTHGPPHNVRDTTHRGIHAGCPFLLRETAAARPLIHCFGHIHEAWGAEVVTWPDDVTAPAAATAARTTDGTVPELSSAAPDHGYTNGLPAPLYGTNPLRGARRRVLEDLVSLKLKYDEFGDMVPDANTLRVVRLSFYSAAHDGNEDADNKDDIHRCGRHRGADHSHQDSEAGSTHPRFPLARGRETLFVNAAYMGRRDYPRQPPWLIEVELQKAE